MSHVKTGTNDFESHVSVYVAITNDVDCTRKINITQCTEVKNMNII